jgi:hypothetical protein
MLVRFGCNHYEDDAGYDRSLCWLCAKQHYELKYRNVLIDMLSDVPNNYKYVIKTVFNAEKIARFY